MMRATLAWRNRPLARCIALVCLGVLAVPIYLALAPASGAASAHAAPFGWLLLAATTLSVAGAGIVLATLGADRSRTRLWAIEVGIIAAVGIVLRVIYLPQPPTLSPDVYRYVWDAHLLLHGVSPYLHAPVDPALAGLRDAAIWPHVGWPDAPTIYPPGAEGFFALVGLVAPLNLGAMKLAMVLCDAVAGVLTWILLRRRGLDPRLAIISWWNPLPILEFALNGHLDALAIALTLGAVAAAQSNRRGARAIVGVLLGLATLVKIYPLLFVVALARSTDRALFATLAGTVALGYALMVPIGLGSGGFLTTYFSQRFVDQGLLQHWQALIVLRLGGSGLAISAVEFLLLGMLTALIAWARTRGALSRVGALLALSAAWIALSPHVLPWYLAAVLPLVALEIASLARAPVVAMWLFALLIPFSYVIFASPVDPDLFQVLFVVPLLVALAPLATRHGRLQVRAWLAVLIPQSMRQIPSLAAEKE
jgi:hypothetical protein